MVPENAQFNKITLLRETQMSFFFGGDSNCLVQIYVFNWPFEIEEIFV